VAVGFPVFVGAVFITTTGIPSRVAVFSAELNDVGVSTVVTIPVGWAAIAVSRRFATDATLVHSATVTFRTFTVTWNCLPAVAAPFHTDDQKVVVGQPWDTK
jgi:hypothetical protein